MNSADLRQRLGLEVVVVVVVPRGSDAQRDDRHLDRAELIKADHPPPGFGHALVPEVGPADQRRVGLAVDAVDRLGGDGLARVDVERAGGVVRDDPLDRVDDEQVPDVFRRDGRVDECDRASGHCGPDGTATIGRMSSDPTTTPLPNPLRATHEQAGAEFQSYADLEVVTTFGEPQAEYAAIRKGCALIDLPQRGVLEFTGRDRLAFLNNLLTNST